MKTALRHFDSLILAGFCGSFTKKMNAPVAALPISTYSSNETSETAHDVIQSPMPLFTVILLYNAFSSHSVRDSFRVAAPWSSLPRRFNSYNYWCRVRPMVERGPVEDNITTVFTLKGIYSFPVILLGVDTRQLDTVGDTMLWPSLTSLLRKLFAKVKLIGTDPARLVVRPDSSTVIADTRISFFCRADGNPLPNVVWRINGKPLTDSRFIVKSLPTGLSTLRIEPVLSTDNQTIVSCSADNGVANPVVADAVITVLSKDGIPPGFPAVDAHPTLKSVEQGRTAHVTCRVRGDPRPKVLWLRDLVPIDIRADGRYSVSTMGNPGALMIQQAREEDQGKYECVARNSLGVVHSKAAHLYVKGKYRNASAFLGNTLPLHLFAVEKNTSNYDIVRRVPPYFSYKLERIYRVGAGGSVNLTCVAVGFPMPRVFWKKSDDVVLSDPAMAPIGKNVLTLTNIEQSKNFTCFAVSKLGNIEATTLVEVKALPPPPRNFKVSSVTSDSVTLTWEAPTLAEPAIEYVIKYRQKYADSNALKKWKVDPLLTSTTIDHLEPFQMYEFVIATVGDFGEGPASIPREAQTAAAAPSPPIKVQARSLSRDSVLVKWSPSEKPNGITIKYRIFYTNKDRAAPVSYWQMQETKSDELVATLYGLETDTRYFIAVQARNVKGDSEMSSVATVTTKHGTPGQPVSLTAKPLDSRRVQLAWEKPLFSLPVTGYVVWFNSSDGEKEYTLTSPHEKHIVMGLEPNTNYAFRVAAISARGQGEFCEPVVVKTMESTPTGPPRLLNVTAISPTALHVLWAAPDAAKSPVVQYRVRYRVVTTENATSDSVSSSYEEIVDDEILATKPPTWYSTVWNASDVMANVTGLLPFTVYEVTVAAATVEGFGPESSSLRRRTHEDADNEDSLPEYISMMAASELDYPDVCRRKTINHAPERDHLFREAP
ncbi:fibronectin type III domain protein [Teladorsagia circumcincta]|uniref:protein-tyrosine-phosphatase n=1 Tax=Teladorsagia circumcincta TaxID=45464 RepID=A0A2G9US22_TELCI|nr:fibronectin type III domain protein [Teladorsagia circumcincta]